MCEEGTCRPCRLEERLTDRAMGTVRTYIPDPKLPSLEENLRNRKVAGLSLMSNTKSKPTPNSMRPTTTTTKIQEPAPKPAPTPMVMRDTKLDISEPLVEPVAPLESVTTRYSLMDKDERKKTHKDKLEYRKKNRVMRSGRLTSTILQTHGTFSGYNNWFCRCAQCTGAYNKRKNENRRKRKG